MKPCPLCDDTGYRLSRKRPNTFVRCECYAERQAEVCRGISNVPANLADALLMSPAIHPGQRRAQARALDFVNGNMDPGKGLLFAGPVGTGKSYIAAGIANALAEQGVYVRFEDFTTFLERLRMSFDGSEAFEFRQSEIMLHALNCHTLVLDDVGAERQTEWTAEVLNVLITNRYNSERTLIVTTNKMDPPEELQRHGIIGPDEAGWLVGYNKWARTRTLEQSIGSRLRSRLWEMCETVVVIGDDARRPKARKS